MWAANRGHARCASRLLAAGADTERASAMGSTALFAAAAGGHAGVVAILLQGGARTDAANMFGQARRAARARACRFPPCLSFPPPNGGGGFGPCSHWAAGVV